MTTDDITLILPIVWSIVATCIGAVLYKTSAALFEDTSRARGRTRSLRLTGSVVIAALAFVGMRSATPVDRLELPRAALKSDFDELDRATLEAQAAIVNGDTITSKAALLRVAHLSGRLRQALSLGDDIDRQKGNMK